MVRILILYTVIAVAYCEENVNPIEFDKLTEISNQNESGLCAYGDGYLPFKIFNSYVGWQCYEEAYKDTKKYSLYACTEKADVTYQIPCLKIGNKVITFNLSDPDNVDLISETVKSDNLRNQMVQCYLSVMAHCESQRFAKAPRPDAGFGTWIWVPNSNAAVCDIQTRSKFHIALLSISLIIGFPAVIVLFYYCWTTNQIALRYHRDLLTALVFRTLFTLLIQSEVFLDMLNVSAVLVSNGSTCKFLSSMETIFGNLVWSFFVSEALYLYKYAKNGFSEEPDIRIYNYILMGISVAFAVIWIIVMAAAHDSNCWLGDRTWIQWINDPLRIIFIILHLVLIGELIRMLLTKLKAVHDDTARILRRISLYTFVLIPLFFLQFALNAGQPESTDCNDPYFYTLYFVDGMQCAVVSLFFFYFDKQIRNLLKATLGLEKSAENEQSNFRKANMERHITTIDATQPIKSERTKELGDANPDVNYSSVVHPEQLEKIIQLYNRMNLTQKPSVTLNEGEEYVSCNPELPIRSRKLSSKSEYYDVESLNEFHDALTYQSSLSILDDVNEFFDPHDKMLSDENFQMKLRGTFQPDNFGLVEKNEINAVQNQFNNKTDARIQKSELPTEKQINREVKPDRVYQSKYLVHDSDTSDSSESEDSVVEVSIRKTNKYEGRLSLRSDVSSRPKSESDLSVAIPIPEEVEPLSDGEKTPEVLLGGLAFDFNKTESIENWIKNNEELYAKYLKKKGLDVPTIVVSSEIIDLEAELNRKDDEGESSDGSEIKEAQPTNNAGNEGNSDGSLDDQESGTESSHLKIKNGRRDSDVYHLLSGSDSETNENKLDSNKNSMENISLMKDDEGNKSPKENTDDVDENEVYIENENNESIHLNLGESFQKIIEPKHEIAAPQFQLNRETIEADMIEFFNPPLQPEECFPLPAVQTESMQDASLSESSRESLSNKSEGESDSEFEVEKLKQMIPIRKSSSSSSDSSSDASSNNFNKTVKLEHESESESECSSSGINDYYNSLASKVYSPSEMKMLHESQLEMTTKPVGSEEPFQINPLPLLNDDLDKLPQDILEVEAENKDLSTLIGNEELEESSHIKEKLDPLFSQDYAADYRDDLKRSSKQMTDNFTEKRQNYSDMFSKYKKKLLRDKNESKSLEDIANEGTDGQKIMPTSSSSNAITNQESLEAEPPLRLEKFKGFVNLNKELENKNTEIRMSRTSESDSSSKNDQESDSSSSDESITDAKPKPTKRTLAPRQVTPNSQDDWEPQKVFY